MEVSPEKEEEKERKESVSDAAMPDLSADLQKLDELVINFCENFSQFHQRFTHALFVWKIADKNSKPKSK